jgi:hypothetical protein
VIYRKEERWKRRVEVELVIACLKPGQPPRPSLLATALHIFMVRQGDTVNESHLDFDGAW